jgi:hypothetical protein
LLNPSMRYMFHLCWPPLLEYMCVYVFIHAFRVHWDELLSIREYQAGSCGLRRPRCSDKLHEHDTIDPNKGVINFQISGLVFLHLLYLVYETRNPVLFWSLSWDVTWLPLVTLSVIKLLHNEAS